MIARLLTLLAASPPLSSAEIQRQLRISQPTASRLLRAAGQRVVRIGRGRATRYAAARPVFDVASEVPLFLVDEAGVIAEGASLQALSTGQYLLRSGPTAPRWLLGERGDGLFESLPYYLFDLRPTGFLGRRIARALAAEWSFPPDPRDWRDEHIGQYLLRRGDDLPGNLLVGEQTARRVQQQRTSVTVVEQPAVEYPRLAQRTLDDENVGSSAAGEQPKFAVRTREVGHVVVKFSPAADTAEACRWRDLLRAEHHALHLLREQGIPAVETVLARHEQRTFLQSRRFDRVGDRGRLPCLSLTMVDAEYVGEGRGWTRVARRLHQRGLLAARSLEQITWAEVFGEWIGNTDMHLGNVSLSPKQGGDFELLPLYDMLPMALAPVRGEIPSRELQPPIRSQLNASTWESAGLAAVAYWQHLADDDQISAPFRTLAHAVASLWRAVL